MNTNTEQRWNALTNPQKRAIADRWITHDSNLDSWCKSFSELSELKKKRVYQSIKSKWICTKRP